jgi:hypothetical protein
MGTMSAGFPTTQSKDIESEIRRRIAEARQREAETRRRLAEARDRREADSAAKS